MRRFHRALLIATVIGLVARLAFGLGYWRDKPLTHDEREYLALALSLANGRGFSYPEAGGEHFGRAPLYPLFLAGVLTASGAPDRQPDAAPRSIKIAQSFVGALAVWLIGLMTMRAAGERAGTIAAALAAIHPPFVWISAYVLSEVFYLPAAIASVMLLGKVLDAERGGAAVVAGIVAGIAAGLGSLVRPAHAVFAALAAIVIARRPRFGRAPLAVAFAAAALTTIAPWTIRNVRTYGRFVPIASEGGITFWTGNHPAAIGEGDMAANPAIKVANVALRRAHAGFTPEQMEPVYYRDALGFIRARPFTWLGLLPRKLFYLVVPVGPSYRLHSNRYYAASALPYLALLPFGVLGWLGLRGRPSEPHALWLLAWSAAITAVVFFPQERFRIPTIDPVLIVCASAWFAGREAGAEARRHRSRR